MLNSVLRGMARALAYLWSGWGAITSLLLFCAAWEAGGRLYGDLVLPGPLATLQQLSTMFASGLAWPELAISARRALYGLGLALSVGTLLGLVAGRSMTMAMAARPLVTLLLGMPPIAWLVLAMLWFGMGDATPVFTVFVACFPLVFAGAMQGSRMLDNRLRDVARAYRLPLRMVLTDTFLPQVMSYLFPVWITALGTAWKVVVMAELLTTVDGVGAALAVSRSQLDTATSLGWILALLGLLLALEYLVLEPIKRHVERWRTESA
ncbi:NitT/TauT family transport system permease protein [Marinobacterium sp. MBR-111]|jgi:NitT/TauT family transport system permease protein|uniref:ABC transporter permease n=1 Tax=Marinobacterium sp. MBR-111 TaxID=3156463 RepID=UPI003399E1BA